MRVDICICKKCFFDAHSGISTIGTLFARHAYSSIVYIIYVVKDILCDVKSMAVLFNLIPSLH